MKTLQPIWRTLFVTVFVLTLTSAAHAQATRTWVGGGSQADDVNPCSRSAPCATFAGTISKTAADGEITVLNPDSYGSVTITKSITINGTDQTAAITNALTTGIIINALTTDVITIRNIAINGVGTGIAGIRILAAKSVHIDHCWIYNQEGHGIDVAATNNVNVKVHDTTIDDCSSDGIHATTTTGQVLLTVDNARIENCGSDGIEAVANVRGAIRNSVVNGNASTGIQTSGSSSQLNIDDVFVSYSLTGIQASNGSTIRVSDSIIAQNTTGVNANTGTLDSFQGNSFLGNTTNGVFSNTTNKT